MGLSELPEVGVWLVWLVDLASLERGVEFVAVLSMRSGISSSCCCSLGGAPWYAFWDQLLVYCLAGVRFGLFLALESFWAWRLVSSSCRG